MVGVVAPLGDHKYCAPAGGPPCWNLASKVMEVPLHISSSGGPKLLSGPMVNSLKPRTVTLPDAQAVRTPATTKLSRTW